MLKRLLDLFFSILGLLFLSPVLIVISLLIFYESGWPIHYVQKRVGKNGKLFNLFKFRTMTVGADKKGLLTIGNDSRVTKIGFFLRKSKLDELPQLINVILGDMSLVGPRPEVEEFMCLYPKDIKNLVLSVRPGITDLASIEMVDENLILMNYSEPRQAYIDVILPLKQKYYVDYVLNMSTYTDLKIIFLTLFKIFSR